jgi:hypothetical protein
MKKVFNDISTIAHYWANKTQSEARNSIGSLYYHNDTIYSYRDNFAIGKHVERNGQNKVLITLRTYSNTTAKHINVVRNASNHLDTIYCYYPNGSHLDNFNAFLKDVESISKSLLTARKPQIYINKIDSVKNMVERYANFFETQIPTTLNEALNIVNLETYQTYVANKETFEKQEKAKQERAKKLQFKKDLKNWMQGKTHVLYNRLNNLDYLRTKDNRLETSQGVKIPIELFKRLKNAYINNTIKIGDKVLEYTINNIDKTHVQIGCHRFELKYLLNYSI